MMFATPCEEYKVNDVLVRALDRIFILHADHEQNASTSTVRLCGSSGANPFAAIAAGVACLWGPAHGGANEACLNMLEELQANGGIAKIGEFIEKVKDKNSGVRLMGFGHRVYKNYDPRAKLMRETCHEVLNELGLHNDPLFKLAMELEKIALEDEYFVAAQAVPERGLLLGHRPARHRHPDLAVHRDLRAGPHGGLDRPVERNARRTPSTRSAVRASCSPVRSRATCPRWTSVDTLPRLTRKPPSGGFLLAAGSSAGSADGRPAVAVWRLSSLP